jgi:hypothetical protein
LGGHDWFTEKDQQGFPVYRMCHCCSKYEQPIISDMLFSWHTIPPNSITAQVMKNQNRIIQLVKNEL